MPPLRVSDNVSSVWVSTSTSLPLMISGIVVSAGEASTGELMAWGELIAEGKLIVDVGSSLLILAYFFGKLWGF